MKVNDIKLGYNQPMAGDKSKRDGKLVVSEEWREKIAALGAKHGKETAQWVKNGQSASHADTMGARHSQEVSSLYKDFVESNGGKITGMVKNHNYADIQAKISDGGDKLGSRYTAAWHEIFSPSFKTELGNHGVESAPAKEGGFRIIKGGELDILA